MDGWHSGTLFSWIANQKQLRSFEWIWICGNYITILHHVLHLSGWDLWYSSYWSIWIRIHLPSQLSIKGALTGNNEYNRQNKRPSTLHKTSQGIERRGGGVWKRQERYQERRQLYRLHIANSILNGHKKWQNNLFLKVKISIIFCPQERKN